MSLIPYFEPPSRATGSQYAFYQPTSIFPLFLRGHQLKPLNILNAIPIQTPRFVAVQMSIRDASGNAVWGFDEKMTRDQITFQTDLSKD